MTKEMHPFNRFFLMFFIQVNKELRVFYNLSCLIPLQLFLYGREIIDKNLYKIKCIHNFSMIHK